jgi:hypothetical protein
MERRSSLIRYPAHARAFLGRARDALARFDDSEDVSALLMAALELRFGIEARLNDYLGAELQRLGRPSSPITEYSATKLLKLLVKENPLAHSPSRLRITSNHSGLVTQLDYTPVTPELAALYGQLGNILHFTFFATRKAWMVRLRSKVGRLETALDARDLIERGIQLLEEATKGTLLTSDVFGRAVKRATDAAE